MPQLTAPSSILRSPVPKAVRCPFCWALERIIFFCFSNVDRGGLRVINGLSTFRRRRRRYDACNHQQSQRKCKFSFHSNSLPLVFYGNAFIASVYILILHCLYVNKILCFVAVVFCRTMSKVLKPCNAVLSTQSWRPHPRVLRLYNAGRRKRH